MPHYEDKHSPPQEPAGARPEISAEPENPASGLDQNFGAAGGPTRFERLLELLANISDEDLARIDAKLDDPNYQPPKVEWLEAPDPFGMDWRWANPPPGRDSDK